MIATSITYDVVFLVHIVAAVDTLIVLIVMRSSAQAVARGADGSIQRTRFPNRRNWAVRAVHVLPVTGLIMSLSGDKSVSLSKPWIGVGILCYLAMAGHLEARTLPQERALAQVIASDGVASPASGRVFVKSIDVLLALIAVALISMLVQF
ncbi:MAG TPA: hypothetical protein VMU68_03935 [Acidimicrobiales bacterium]|nr:hypothetical protein [Acidimicrobiales bacterium]